MSKKEEAQRRSWRLIRRVSWTEPGEAQDLIQGSFWVFPEATALELEDREKHRQDAPLQGGLLHPPRAWAEQRWRQAGVIGPCAPAPVPRSPGSLALG